ncbi:LOW QUALITY PROTEIN: hypothetical protein ACHAW6_000899 [Cyclotella cf. meneghiniana]
MQFGEMHKLLVLGALRYLGHGWMKKLLQYLKKYIGHSSSSLSNLVVLHFMRRGQGAHERFVITGLPGALGSTDATHITMWNCEYNYAPIILSKNTMHSYNMTVNHWHCILHSTQGGPGRWNDQTMGLLENFVKGIHDDKHLQEDEFKLLEFQNGRVVLV